LSLLFVLKALEIELKTLAEDEAAARPDLTLHKPDEVGLNIASRSAALAGRSITAPSDGKR